MEDNRRLIPMRIMHLDGDNWIVSIDGGESYSVKGDIESVKKALRRIKAKDGENKGKCRSSKVGTYLSMISDQGNAEHKINVWKSKVPQNAEEFKKLMECMEMNEIKLTKNYLIEGNIVPKGTVVRFKEAEADNGIAFLPTDVWEKAKEIVDENERFEYVKKEVGDEFTDEEIKDFLNKYKSKLNKIRRFKRMTGAQLEDLETALRETLELEGLVSKDSIDDVVELAKGDKELLDAWEAVYKSDEKSLEKKENHFWKVFDDICKPFKNKKSA